MGNLPYILLYAAFCARARAQGKVGQPRARERMLDNLARLRHFPVFRTHFAVFRKVMWALFLLYKCRKP